MARVQYGTIVTEIKGKNQGHVFQGGNVGFVLRSKGYTPGISSQARNQANTYLTTQSSRWRLLTDAQRNAWGALAPDWLFYNKFGAAYQGNGFQIFNSYNTNLLNLTQPTVDDPGAVRSAADPGTVDFDWGDTNGARVTFGNTGTANQYMLLFAAAPASAGRNSNHARYRLIDAVDINGQDTIIFTSDYTAIFATPDYGQRITIKCVFFDIRFPYPFFPSIRTTLRSVTP